MTLSAGDRIAMIRECATLLDKQRWDDIDLVLEQHDLPTKWDGDKPDERSTYVKNMIKNADDDSLSALHGYLTSEADGSTLANSPWSGDKLRLFCSHLAIHKDYVGQVGEELQRFGIEPFVAHDAIEPSKEWAQVIEAALGDCDAAVVFLHQGFRESNWCDQEIGWLLGRKRPTLPLGFGFDPYGFLGKFQAQPCTGQYPVAVARLVVDWLSKTPSVHARLGKSLVDAFVTSSSWDRTRAISTPLERIDTIDDDDLGRMEQAARDNVDVRECSVFGTSGPAWVKAFVEKRRGPVGQPAFADEPPF